MNSHYTITRENGGFTIRHFTATDPNPTIGSEVVTTSGPEAWTIAFGRAAKQSAMLHKPIEVWIEDRRKYEISAKRLV